MQHSELTGTIIGKAIELHEALGPGQTEARYTRELATALKDADLYVRLRVKAWQQIGERWKLIDTFGLVVEGLVGVLITTRQRPPDDRQLGHLLRMVQARGLPVGLVLNFGPHKIEVGRADERAQGSA